MTGHTISPISIRIWPNRNHNHNHNHNRNRKQNQNQNQNQDQNHNHNTQPQPQEKTPNVEPKEFYGYLFDANKSPTPVLNALLRGIANYIIENVGSKEDQFLTPEKLALFYKAVGGNYDSLFVETTHPSISWIYASIGCQHALNPTKDDFAPPSIPCLTVRGFVRWQSIEVLLGPEEHVSFIQTAVRDFEIKHPDTGERFPTELPKEAFPLVPDPEIEKWHRSCAEKLRRRASPDDEEEVPAPDLPPRPEAQTTYAHVRPSPRVPEPTPTNAHPRSGYFEPSTREPSSRESSTREPPPRESTTREHSARESAARESTPRRSTRPIPTPTSQHPALPNVHRSTDHPPIAWPSPPLSFGPRLRPPPSASRPTRSGSCTPAHPRRHSHPRQARRVPIVSDASDSSTDASLSSDSEDDPSPKSRRSPLQTAPGARRIPRHPQSAYVTRSSGIDGPRAFAFSSTAPGSTNPSPISDARERERERERQRDIEDKFRRGQYPTNIDLNGKLSAPFLAARRKREMGRGRVICREDRGDRREKEREKGIGTEIGMRGIGGTENETTSAGKDLGSKRDTVVTKTSQHAESDRRGLTATEMTDTKGEASGKGTGKGESEASVPFAASTGENTPIGDESCAARTGPDEYAFTREFVPHSAWVDWIS
ncbi:hypothetical protein EYC84_004127 [Monilinia fructicola]|uniref:DUF7514 domain-containing protein n=1 Tax=Monilinia fructicola TaxID=38448 RepID=A0A5M9K3Z2_MONFR|nr:hypothetical protein EYC84_004127 [Monilinia fructicola]